MELETVVRRRRMVRAYLQRPVEEQQIERILRMAHQAPSAGFTQPQEYVIVRDATIKRSLAVAALGQLFLAEAPVIIAVCSNTTRSAARYGRRGVEFYSIIDGAFASMLILLAAVNEGLGACFVGAFRDDQVASILRLPGGVRPIGLIAIGYPLDEPQKLRRRSLQAIVHRDAWSSGLVGLEHAVDHG
jgi:nitroreductase